MTLYFFEVRINCIFSPKKDEGEKDEGYYVFSSTFATDGLGSSTAQG
jgi:hypothetical protein